MVIKIKANMILTWLFGLLSCSDNNEMPFEIKSQNDQIIYAFPNSNIKIDADIQDWKNIPAYQIDKTISSGANPSLSDLEGKFKIAYNTKKQLIYLCVEIVDDEIIESKKVGISDQDSYSFYIDEQHIKSGSGIARYSFTTAIQATNDSSTHWDPRMDKLLDLTKVKNHSIRVDTNKIIHEIAFKLEKPIYNERVIRIGHAIRDVDSDQSKWIGWTRRGGKDLTSQPGRLGYVILADNKTKTSLIQGTVKWKDSLINIPPSSVRIEAKSNPDFWLHIPISRDSGTFKVNLPLGQYRLSPGMFTHFTGFDFTKADMNDHLEFEAIDSLTSLPFYYMKSVTKPVLPGQGNALFDLSTQLIDSTISAYMDYYQIEGVVFATLAKDRISYLATYGTKNSYTNQPIKASSLFEVASITKPFLAYAALRLYDKGLLDLDLPLSSYLPFQAISNSEYAQLITARQVLTHQTGLPNWPTGGRLDFKFEPGTGFEYSGSAYQYLGRVMESITGKSIDEIMKEEISVGLGIDHLYFKKSFYAYKNKVHGHFNGFPGVIDLPDQPWMAGSLVTNASALAKFIFAIHNRRGLKDETYEQIFSNYIEIPERYKENNWGYRESMGLGFFIEHAPYGRVFKHSGNNGDFKAVFRYYEDLDKGYILLTNGNTGHFIINAIEKILIDPTLFAVK